MKRMGTGRKIGRGWGLGMGVEKEERGGNQPPLEKDAF